MGGRLPQQWLDELYAKANICDVVSRYVALKKDGKRYWGLCPFHNEKTPSFSVTADANLYYCFGCKAGGNVVQFISEMEHLNYSDAALFLGDMYRMPPPNITEDPEWEKKRSIRDRLKAINTEAARFYHDCLWKEEGRAVLQYLYSRGLTDQVIRKFGLGAAPDAWDAVLTYLKGLGYTEEDAALAGLCVKKENGCFDMFRNRAIFPIIDASGQVIGFGGRTMGDAKPKYLNTSDTPVFNKRLGVFAANLIKKERGLKRIILTEGYMDVISLWQAGITGAVATLGTSLTVEQARLLHRFCPEIWICYDGDEPGQHAIERAIGIFASEDIPVKVLQLPPGIDPDEYVRQNGKEAFMSLTPDTAVHFLMNRILGKAVLADPAGRADAAKSCAEVLKGVKDPVDIEIYIEYLSSKTGFAKDVLYSQIGVTKAVPSVLNMRPAHPAARRGRDERDKKDKAFKAEQTLVCMLLLKAVPEGLINKEDFSYPLFSKTAEKLISGIRAEQIMEEAEDSIDRAMLSETFAMCADDMKDNHAAALQDCLKTLRISNTEKKIDELKEEISSITDADKRNETMQEIMRLMKLLNTYKAST